MVQNYYRIERVLDGEAVEGVELDPFPAWFPQLWSRDGNNECMFCWYCIGPLSCSDSLSAVARSFSLSISAPSHANAAGSLVAFLNLIIILQTGISQIFPKTLRSRLSPQTSQHFAWTVAQLGKARSRLSSYLVFYMSSKWFNYFGILVSVAFDQYW